MDKARVLRAMFAFAFAFAVLFSCSESGGGNSKTPAEEKAENAVGKTNDGHDVVVFNPGDLDEVLFKIDTVYITDTSFLGKLFFRNLPVSKTPEPGDIINSTIAKNAPSGFLYRVADVTKESEDVTIVSVGYASIAEAVKEAEIEFTVPFVYDENGGRLIVVQAEGDGQARQFLAKNCGSYIVGIFTGDVSNSCISRAANSLTDIIEPVTDAMEGFVRFVVTGDGEFDTKTSGGIRVNEEVSILENELGPFKAKGSVGLDGSYTVWLTMKMKVVDYKFEHFKVVAGHAKDFKFKGKLEGKVSKAWEKTLFEGYLGQVEVPVGGITVTLDNSAIVKVKLEAEATAKMEAGITFKETNEYGVEYTKDKGWEPIDRHSKESDYYYKHSIYGQVRFGLLAGLKTMIYGNAIGIDLLAGPSLVVKNDMLSGDLKKGLWSDPKITLDADVDFDMHIRVGFLEQIAKQFKEGFKIVGLHIPQGNLMKNEIMPGIYFTADTKTSFNSESKTPSDLDLTEIDKGKLSFQFHTAKSGPLGFSIKEVGFCVEPKEGECVKGPGIGEGKLAKLTEGKYDNGTPIKNYEGYDIGAYGMNDSFTANFEGLAPGTYNIVPYFKALDDEIYYDTAGALKNFVISNYCGEGGRGAYDPETQFCSGTSVYDKCGGNTYDPSAKFCSGDVLYDMCGGRNYVPAVEFCLGNAVYSKCGNKTYDPVIQICLSNNGLQLYDRCGDSYVNPEARFCYDNTLYNLCGGKSYNPTTQFCQGGDVLNKCVGKNYNSETQFCSGNEIYSKCGYNYNIIYDPSTQFCGNYLVYDLCGGKSYNPSTQFCLSNALYDLCGGSSYNPSTQFCSAQEIYNKCNGSNYDPSIKFCSGNTLYELCGSSSYNPSTQFCFNKTVYPKCDGKSYDPLKGEMCCGTKMFNIKAQGCSNNELVDKTEELLIDPRDGQAYRTTVIGTQTWMAQNLNYSGSNYSIGMCSENGIEYYPLVSSGGFCNIPGYGRLYSYEESNNVCPDGWHLSKETEWITLIEYVGGPSDFTEYTTEERNLMVAAFTKLKAVSGWNNIGEGMRTDAYGLSILPIYNGTNSSYAYLWIEGAYDYPKNYLRIGQFISKTYGATDDIAINRGPEDPISVRCVKD
jgi:uncharacterized protein (TIGR02145 family)